MKEVLAHPSFAGSLLGAVITGAIAIWVMNRNFNYDKKVREIDDLKLYLKSTKLLIEQLGIIVNELEFSEDENSKNDAHNKAHLEILTNSYKLILGIHPNDVDFKIYEEYLKARRLSSYGVESYLNMENGIYDSRANGLLDYAGQLRNLKETIENYYKETYKRYKKLKN